MNNDVSTMFTKHQNIRSGRKGYGRWKREKISSMSPYYYGSYIISKKKNRRRHEV